jgi:hypothetical protein
MSIDKCAVGGIKVANNNVGPAQQNFAMMAGDRTLGNGKSIIVHTTDGGFVHRQFMSFARQSFAKNN